MTNDCSYLSQFDKSNCDEVKRDEALNKNSDETLKRDGTMAGRTLEAQWLYEHRSFLHMTAVVIAVG